MSIELRLSRANRIYQANEALEGKIIVKSPSSISHYGIRLSVSGSVNLQVRGGSAGVIESFYGVLRPIPILKKSIEVRPSGKIGSGTTEIPFSLILRQPGEVNLERFYETFHGANINTQYLVAVDIMRGYLHKTLSATLEFIVESDKAELIERPVSPEMVLFYITQDTQRHPLLAELKSGGFRVTGKMSTQCSLSDPVTGELTVEASAVPICSIDIHLLRVESVLLGERIVTETSLIQTTQIADGDVCRNVTLSIYVILPRLLTCPTIFAGKIWKTTPGHHKTYPYQAQPFLPTKGKPLPAKLLNAGSVHWLFMPSQVAPPFSIEYKVSVAISFHSELSKLHSISDPTAPRLWMAMETLPLELVRTR